MLVTTKIKKMKW